MIEQRIALHAAKSWDGERRYGPNKDLTPIGLLLSFGLEPPARIDLYAKSAIVGVATIDRVVTEGRTIRDDQRRWYFGSERTPSASEETVYGWILRDVQLLTPIPCAGKQGLWTVPDAIAATITEELAA
jgi:hypothetical protein